MLHVAHRVGYKQDAHEARKQVNLIKLDVGPEERLMAAEMIVNDANRTDLFLSLLEEDMLFYVIMLLCGHF